MFYCDKCKEKNNYPESLVKSYGQCELCGKTEECNDVPSNRLPKPVDENGVEIKLV